ncbi:hypothetical protein TRFO_06097 [Tritrichomonas foetus]|uniref:Uncharacterized protein n=1 Tax=Tritrichomonas foetus TaxID=1144522 RepID=A0A1J4K2Q2_9EUKA|nr:hypothetical protein TRFO_06097 [Tritrichomonas foetus]|eukprot:OHT05088.1 hypothetical protein TRFO_06097 [Tritrichomonas foetus]
MDEMKKRAYLSRYMEEVQIPEEIKVDPMISELLGQHRELREKFEFIQQEFENVGGTNVDELKASISDLEADKARLASRISSFKRKMEKVKNLELLLKLTSKLRNEGEREMKLQEQMQRLNDEKRLLLHRQQVATDRYKNMRVHMETKLNSLRTELDTLKNKDANNNSPDSQLVMAQKQVIAATLRLDQKEKQLSDIQKATKECEEKLQQRKNEGCIEIPSPNDFVVYVRNLKTKNETYKGYQTDIAGHRKELAILKRTEDIVREQQKTFHNEILIIERKRGITGFRETRQQLESVSSSKAEFDDIKGKTLEEMSKIVKEIQSRIKERQSELKPFVAKLQEQRKLKAQIESKYLVAKQKYLNIINEYDTASMELEEETRKLQNDIAIYHSKFHNVTQQFSCLERLNKRTRDESKAVDTGNCVSNEIKTYSDYLQKSARVLKKETKALKEQKKTLGNQNEHQQKQLDTFQSLQQLLKLKEKCQKDAAIKKANEIKQDEIERKKLDQIIDLRQTEILDI